MNYSPQHSSRASLLTAISSCSKLLFSLTRGQAMPPGRKRKRKGKKLQSKRTKLASLKTGHKVKAW